MEPNLYFIILEQLIKNGLLIEDDITPLLHDYFKNKDLIDHYWNLKEESIKKFLNQMKELGHLDFTTKKIITENYPNGETEIKATILPKGLLFYYQKIESDNNSKSIELASENIRLSTQNIELTTRNVELAQESINLTSQNLNLTKKYVRYTLIGIFVTALFSLLNLTASVIFNNEKTYIGTLSKQILSKDSTISKLKLLINHKEKSSVVTLKTKNDLGNK